MDGADYVIGTSAGAMVGAMLASAVPPWLLLAYGSGESLQGMPILGEASAARFGASFQIHWTFPRPVLASPARCAACASRGSTAPRASLPGCLRA
jgi:hypothetical protein